MANKYFAGLNVAAFKKVIKEDRKATEKNGRRLIVKYDDYFYYCNGFMIFRLPAKLFNSFADTMQININDVYEPGTEPDFKSTFERFSPENYTVAAVTKWRLDGDKFNETAILSENAACLVQTNYINCFDWCTVSINGIYSPVAISYAGDVFGYIMPVRPSDKERAALEALRAVYFSPEETEVKTA